MNVTDNLGQNDIEKSLQPEPKPKYAWLSGGTKIEYPYPWEIINGTDREQQGNIDERGRMYLEKKSNPIVGIRYCVFCDANVDHSEFDCPKREQGIGMACMYCFGPCQEEWKGMHGKMIITDMLKRRVLCHAVADHWAIDCPLNVRADEIWDEDDDGMGF